MNIKQCIQSLRNKIKRTWVRNKAVQIEHFLESRNNPINLIPYFIRLHLQKKISLKNMRLGVAYNLFDGEELLEYSIKSIRNNVDFICVVWQKTSYHGESCNPKLESFLNGLVESGLIDEIYLYEPNDENTGGEISSFKRNIGLELCKKNNCNYHMSMDTDEFYTDEQFNFMKKEMIRGNYGTGYCRQIQYYKDAIYQLKCSERNYVTTIEKIMPDTKYVYKIACAIDVSPERKTNNSKNGLPYRIFKRYECEMHHMSFIRKDIAKKVRNSSLDEAFGEERGNIVSHYYQNWKYPEKCMWMGENLLDVVKVPRQFEIYKVD